MTRINLFHTHIRLNSGIALTMLCSKKLHIAGTWDSHEISLSDKKKIGQSSRCIYCAWELNWKENVYNLHQHE